MKYSGTVSGVKQPGVRTPSLTSHMTLTSMCLSFLICKMALIKLWKVYHKPIPKNCKWAVWLESAVERGDRLELLQVKFTQYSPWTSSGQNTGVVTVPFSRGSSQPKDRTQVSHIADEFFTSWATKEAPGVPSKKSLKWKFRCLWFIKDVLSGKR